MRPRFPLSQVGAAVLVLAPVVGTVAAAAPRPDFAACEKAVRDHPDRKDSFRCFWEVARARKAWDEAARRLEAHLARDPSNPGAKLTLAWVEWDRGGDRVEVLFREAGDAFALAHDPNGEVFARLGLAWFLRQRGRPTEADPAVQQALAAARASDDPTLVARVRIDQSEQAYARSAFGEALSLLAEAEAIAVAKGANEILAIVLGNQAYGWWELGMYRQSSEAYARQADLYRAMGTRWGATFEESKARFNIAVLAGRLHAEGELERDEVARLAREAVASAESAGARLVEANARLFLTHWLEAPGAAAELERGLALARATGDRRAIRYGLRLLARRQALADPSGSGQGYRTIEDAIADAEIAGDREDVARGLVMRAAMRLRTGPRQRWLDDSEASLTAIERIRDLQPDSTVRALVFGPWAFTYYRFSGCLLSRLAAAQDPAADLDLALRTIERMRARVLLDCLDRAGAGPKADESDPAAKRRGEVLARIAEVQRTLTDEAKRDETHRAALQELERLSAEEASLRDAISRSSPAFGRGRPTALAGVTAVQERLAGDQALLSVQLAPSSPDAEDRSEDGGSWVVLLTRTVSKVFPLPRRSSIEDQEAVYLGLCRRRDGSERRAAARLYRELVEGALQEAGPGIRRLVIVPDACLNRLPFGSLCEGPEPGSPLAARLEITEVPSATLWVRWKGGEGAAPEPGRDLGLADPELGAPGAGDPRAAGPTIARMPLGRLPHARREASTLAHAIGPGSIVLLGRDASEGALKRTDLGPYGVLHFATHAVVDDAHPERSAIVLSPGGSAEDGLLRLREIVRLPLERKVVVLSGCRSASGTEVEGEGVLGLARGFFQAGASAVVGTLWPVRDDDMERFMAAFAAELHRGSTLSAAQRGAVQSAMRAGLPAAAWAGTVVLGDGDVAPVRNGRATSSITRLIAIAAALALAGFLLWRRRREVAAPR